MRHAARTPTMGQFFDVFGWSLCPILAGILVHDHEIRRGQIYISSLVMISALLAIFAILATPETKGVRLET